MVQKTKSVGKGQRATPPFIFLSDVLQDYGSCKFRSDETAVDPQHYGDASKQVAVTLGGYLADKIEKTEVLLFDVHSLKLISGLELKEVLEYLRRLGQSNATDIGIEHGRDYCLDGERAMQAIWQVIGNTPPRRSGKRKLSVLSAKPLTPASEADPRREDKIECWGFETEYFSVEAMQLKLAEARVVARREKAYPSPLAARASANKKVHALPPGATVPSQKFAGQGTYFYSIETFNREGLPALSLDAAVLTRPPRPSEKNERNAKWQSLLKSMYLLDKEKSHTALCEKLAIRLNNDRGRGDGEVTAATIRRNTEDPGKRSVGGSKPRTLLPKKD